MSGPNPSITLRELVFSNEEEFTEREREETEEDFEYMDQLALLSKFSRYPLRAAKAEELFIGMFKEMGLIVELKRFRVEGGFEHYAYERLNSVYILLGRYDSDFVLHEPSPTQGERKS